MTKQDAFSGSSQSATAPSPNPSATTAANTKTEIKSAQELPHIASPQNFEAFLRPIAINCGNRNLGVNRKRTKGNLVIARALARKHPNFVSFSAISLLLNLLKLKMLWEEPALKSRLSDIGFGSGKTSNEHPYSVTCAIIETLACIVEQDLSLTRAQNEMLKNRLGEIMGDSESLCGKGNPLNQEAAKLMKKWLAVKIVDAPSTKPPVEEVSIPTSTGRLMPSGREARRSTLARISDMNAQLAYGVYGRITLM